ncbi:MAG: hypothetical protein ABSF56_02640 [Minisyncoccia bacterium]|jgi:ribulose-phosphate 3-epimerase
MSKIEIIPAILPKDFKEIEDKAVMVKGLVKTVQIDICDGHFVPSFTWPYKKHDDSFEKIVHEEEGLPCWQDLDYEFDLMVDSPEKVVDEWVEAGGSRIIVHAESKGNVGKAIDILQDRVEIGLALNEDTPLDAINPYREKINFVQLMGIDKIGFQGQAFDEKVDGRIKEARIKFPGLPISIDGGVSLETAPELVAAGADRLVAGSAIFSSDNVVEALEKFKRLSSRPK